MSFAMHMREGRGTMWNARALCGTKPRQHFHATRDRSEVTCKRCLAKLALTESKPAPIGHTSDPAELAAYRAGGF